jgi:DNA-binding transcriptional MerR regulator
MTSVGFTISEVAERTGLTWHTLRYYERDGLMLGVDRAGDGNEDERLALLRAHRERVRVQLDTMAAYLDAIDMKIGYYTDAIEGCESPDSYLSSPRPEAASVRR